MVVGKGLYQSGNVSGGQSGGVACTRSSSMSGIRVTRRGFTIVELLVVISIIGMLIALLLPAVQAAREAGRRATCNNNLHQLGLAMLNYESVHKVFPLNWGYVAAGAANPDNTGVGSIGHSWLAGVLPFLEWKPLSDTIKDGQPMSQLDNRKAAKQVLPELICPSDLGNGSSTNQVPLRNDNTVTDKTLATTNYKACAGMNWGVSATTWVGGDHGGGPVTSLLLTPPGKGRFATHPTSADLTSQADYAYDHGNGIICRGRYVATSASDPVKGGAVKTTTADIRDGLSKTFAIGECVPDWCLYSAWYSYEGSTATCALPPNYRRSTATPDADAVLGFPPTNGSSEGRDYSSGFMSRHPRGVNMAMCDGSVTFILEDIDRDVYWALSTIDGSEIARLPD
jgi:prepilin-type N-terminal cleavage/methylation domain-containing protein/prepilin-type processing-associated H-X9-DG protein